MRRRALAAARAKEGMVVVNGPRARTTTTVTVGRDAVKRTNMYDLDKGEPSVWAQEALVGRAGPPKEPKRRGKAIMHRYRVWGLCVCLCVCSVCVLCRHCVCGVCCACAVGAVYAL